ncbi:hypothetical protein Acsp03_29680 [Actinomadura sp. NBRC 104412]|nr:hypothetical protein Acsp03_29680 [Actinomadura sp. NBRC 104412]
MPPAPGSPTAANTSSTDNGVSRTPTSLITSVTACLQLAHPEGYPPGHRTGRAQPINYPDHPAQPNATPPATIKPENKVEAKQLASAITPLPYLSQHPNPERRPSAAIAPKGRDERQRDP